jgi:hypothetical protein
MQFGVAEFVELCSDIEGSGAWTTGAETAGAEFNSIIIAAYTGNLSQQDQTQVTSSSRTRRTT